MTKKLVIKQGSILHNVRDIANCKHEAASVTRIMNNVLVMFDLKTNEGFVTHKEQVHFRGYQRSKNIGHFNLAASLRRGKLSPAISYHNVFYERK